MIELMACSDMVAGALFAEKMLSITPSGGSWKLRKKGWMWFVSPLAMTLTTDPLIPPLENPVYLTQAVIVIAATGHLSDGAM
jgi:hypothetical protein